MYQAIQKLKIFKNCWEICVPVVSLRIFFICIIWFLFTCLNLKKNIDLPCLRCNFLYVFFLLFTLFFNSFIRIHFISSTYDLLNKPTFSWQVGIFGCKNRNRPIKTNTVIDIQKIIEWHNFSLRYFLLPNLVFLVFIWIRCIFSMIVLFLILFEFTYNRNILFYFPL